MFTGIVEEVGSVGAFDGARLRVEARRVLDGAAAGSSIAVNGCCLTVVESGAGWCGADVAPETLRRTNLGSLSRGDPVNLERPVRLGDRLGGHLVQGHVDGVGTVESPAPDMRVTTPPDLLRYVVEKGSIAVDGCSLTVTEVLPDGLAVTVVPHTAESTTLGRRPAGASVNLEVDVIAKYAERLLAGVDPSRRGEASR